MDLLKNSASLNSLLARTGRGDAAAFHALYLLSARPLLYRALRIVGCSASAEDVLQDSFIAIWRDAQQFDGTRSAPMTWMGAIVRNKGIDFLRANQQRDRLTAIDDSREANALADLRAGPCEAAELRQQSILIGNGLKELKDIHREAIELAFFHELSHGEVAAEMTIPLGTVKTWIRRGCKQMRRHMALSDLARAYGSAC